MKKNINSDKNQEYVVKIVDFNMFGKEFSDNIDIIINKHKIIINSNSNEKKTEKKYLII
jgi:hypothetical protein